MALKIAELHFVVVNQTNSPHARRSQVKRCRGTQTPCTDNKHTGLVEPTLTIDANIGKAEVPSVARNINHDGATRLSHIKEAASVNVLFEPFFNVDGG